MQAKSFHGVTDRARETLVRLLHHVLQDECSLSAITRDYGWNLTGPNIYSLHRLFDEQRLQLDAWLDRVMQRPRAAGLGALGGVTGATPVAQPAASGAGLPPDRMIADLLARHEQLAHRLREEMERLRDPGMTDLLRGLLEFHETSAWMLRMLCDGPDRAA